MASSFVAERLPPMYGSATAAMEVSSTSMKVASITAVAINHGFTGGLYGIGAISEGIARIGVWA